MFFFSYDLVLVFIAKALLLSSVIFKTYSHLSNSRQKCCRGCHMSQSVDVARWVRSAIGHAQDALFWWVRPEVRVWFRALFLEIPVLVQPFMLFLLLVFSFVVLVLSPLQKSNCLFWVCLSTFWCFVLRLKSSLQKNNLSGSKLVLIQFGYRGFSFLSHAVWLWFMVFSNLALVSLNHYIIPFQPG